MKNLRFLSIILASLFYACSPSPASFNIETKNFPLNSVLSIYNAKTGETYKIENIANGQQHFKINIKQKGYAALRTESGGREREYWFYIDSGTFHAVLDANNNKNYPFKSVPTEEGDEFIAFYKTKASLSNNILDSLNKAQVEFDKSSRENVVQKAKVFDAWMEKKDALDLNVIQAFAKKYPNSHHTIFLLDQLGQVDAHTEMYVSIFNGLGNEVKESTAGKNLLDQIMRLSKMRPGNMIPNIEGQTPTGKAFNKSVLKKVNLIIVWTSYNTKTRENSKLLTDLYDKFKDKDVEFIGISLDKKKDWWVNVIKDDKLIWPQFSDLKGAKSPNAKNLSDYNIPYFFLVDKEGKILMNNDLKPEFISDEINKYL